MNTTQIIAAWIAAFYTRHEGVVNLFAVAAIVNMPRGKGESPLYGWLYATLQSFMGALKPHPQETLTQSASVATFLESKTELSTTTDEK
jgi:hypothetical protein